MEEAGDARPDDVYEVGDGDLLVVEEVHSGEEALALLRHVKWFYSRALSRHSCTVVIRILRDLCQRNPTWSPLKCWPPPPPKHHRGGRKQRISSSGEADGATLEKILSSRIPKNVLKKKTTRKQDLPDGEPTYGPQTEFYACFARGRREQRKIKVSFTTTTTRADDGSPPALASKPASTTSADTDTGSPPPPLAAPPNLQQPRELGIPKMCLRGPESLFCSSYSLDEK